MSQKGIKARKHSCYLTLLLSQTSSLAWGTSKGRWRNYQGARPGGNEILWRADVGQPLRHTPHANSLALHASLWAIILLFILQMGKRPWRVQHALAAHPVGLWSSPPSLPSEEIQTLCTNLHSSGVCLPPGPCLSQPTFHCKLQWNGRGAILGLLGREEETGLGRWSAQDSPGRATGLERETGLEPKTNNPFIIVPGPVLTQLLLCAVEEIAALGSWEVLPSHVERKVQSPASNHQGSLFCSSPGAGVKGLRPCYALHSGILSRKETFPVICGF